MMLESKEPVIYRTVFICELIRTHKKVQFEMNLYSCKRMFLQ